MLNPIVLKAAALADILENNFVTMFGREELIHPGTINTAARLILNIIGNSDALYHDVDHTLSVTLVGQTILLGRHIREEVSSEDWLHFTVACLCHDIGYVRGICSSDTTTSFVIDEAGNRVTPPRGASDAFLTPYHVDRGKIFVRERLGGLPYIDADRVAAAIELTRFPAPETTDHQETKSEAGLLRAADLIGQLADPSYMQKLHKLYYEFKETGAAERLGYASPADLAEKYPGFFWAVVQPYIADAVEYLQLTQEGKQWVANLHSHVFAIEHGQFRFGPYIGKAEI
jgi:hypothetical protein